MRPDRASRRAFTLTLILLLLGGGIVAGTAAVEAAGHPCDAECPSDDCGEQDLGCGCCALVVPAVVPIGLVVSASSGGPAAPAAAPEVPAPTVVHQLLQPPRLLVS